MLHGKLDRNNTKQHAWVPYLTYCFPIPIKYIISVLKLLRVYVSMTLILYRTIETGMIENGLPCLRLHSMLGGLLSMIWHVSKRHFQIMPHTSKCSTSMTTMCICAHGPTVLTNPERSDGESFMSSR